MTDASNIIYRTPYKIRKSVEIGSMAHMNGCIKCKYWVLKCCATEPESQNCIAFPDVISTVGETR